MGLSLYQNISPYNLAVDALGEVALTLWLLVMGVNSQRWKEQASLGLVGEFGG